MAYMDVGREMSFVKREKSIKKVINFFEKAIDFSALAW
jgi:hypothetical protein